MSQTINLTNQISSFCKSSKAFPSSLSGLSEELQRRPAFYLQMTPSFFSNNFGFSLSWLRHGMQQLHERNLQEMVLMQVLEFGIGTSNIALSLVEELLERLNN